MTDQETPKQKTVKKKAASSAAGRENFLPEIKSVLAEMKQDRESRDRQLASLAQGVREGLGVISEQAEKRDSQRDKEMVHLFEGLNAAFTRANAVGSERDDRSTQMIRQLTESVMHDHEATLKEVQEQEALADKKMDYLSTVQEQRLKRNQWIAIPGVALAAIAVVYMFYVVTVMERAMTSMSHDMQQMTVTIDHMNGNVGQITRDMNVLTHNVAPAMKGMRNAMPWAP